MFGWRGWRVGLWSDRAGVVVVRWGKFDFWKEVSSFLNVGPGAGDGMFSSNTW